NRCHATPDFWAYIMANGEVYSCSAYLLDNRFKLGNINDQSFRGIWHGFLREKNWRFVREKLDIRECRVNCRMARVNEYLEDLKRGPVGVNFI
ncbi:MAG: SPASM domain-containing protein, partial [Parcubacteria group bacterium]